jgi:hypothetical protein
MVAVQVQAGERFYLLDTYQTRSATNPVSCQLDTVSYLPHIKTTFCFHASIISKYFTSFKKQFCHFKNESCIPQNQKASTSQFLPFRLPSTFYSVARETDDQATAGWLRNHVSVTVKGRHFLFSTDSKLPLGPTIQSLCIYVNGGYDPGS